MFGKKKPPENAPDLNEEDDFETLRVDAAEMQKVIARKAEEKKDTSLLDMLEDYSEEGK